MQAHNLVHQHSVKRNILLYKDKVIFTRAKDLVY